MSTTAPPPVAPPRNRRRWIVVVGFVLAVLATPFLYRWISGWMRERQLEAIYRELDAEDPHWRWPDLIANLPPAPPDEKNAAVQLTKVSEILKKGRFFPPDVFAKKGVNADRHLRNTRFSRKDAELLRAALAGKPVEEARKLKDLPEGRITIDPLARPDKHQIQFHALFWVMECLRYDAMLKADDGHIAAAAESTLALLNASNASDFPTLFGQVIRSAGQDHALYAMEITLARGRVDADYLASLQTALEREARHGAVYSAMRGDRAYDHASYLAMRDGSTPEQVLEAYKQLSYLAKIRRVFSPRLVDTYAERLRAQNEQVRAGKLFDQGDSTAWVTLHQELGQARDTTSMLAFAGGTAKEFGRTRAAMQCAVTAVAAERFRLENDRWPRDAKELVERKFLKDIPKDPYDGQPLRWRRTAIGLIIYSVGEDKVDDGAALKASDMSIPAKDIGFLLWDPAWRHVEPAVEVKKRK